MTPSLNVDASPVKNDLAHTLLHVAWMSVLLGVLMQVILLVAVRFDSLAPLVREVSQKISWSVVICVGLAIGNAAAKAKEVWMGLAGLLAAPLAFAAAKTIHKSVGQALSLLESGGSSSLFWWALIIKTAQYTFFGIAIGMLSKRGSAKLVPYVAVGGVAGIVFGGLLQVVISRFAELSTAALIAGAINEILFPIGCAIVLYAASALGSRVKTTD